MRLRLSPEPVVFLCLRCGREGVLIPAWFFLDCRGTYCCHYCEAEHFLSLKQREDEFIVCFDRWTRRYPLESYDDCEESDLTAVRLHASRVPPQEHENHTGPIIISRRKKRFTKPELKSIWKASNGRCHICEHHWRLKDHCRAGWHVDHVIPNVSGGPGTELMANFRVACAKCNLKKGRGYKELDIHHAVAQLVSQFEVFNSRA